jgi:hypothetical protein
VTASGIVVMRSARRFHSVIGMAVSAASVHLVAQEGLPVDGVLALEVGQHRIDGVLAGVHGGAVGGLTMSSPSVVGPQPCVTSLSA